MGVYAYFMISLSLIILLISLIIKELTHTTKRSTPSSVPVQKSAAAVASANATSEGGRIGENLLSFRINESLR